MEGTNQDFIMTSLFSDINNVLALRSVFAAKKKAMPPKLLFPQYHSYTLAGSPAAAF